MCGVCVWSGLMQQAWRVVVKGRTYVRMYNVKLRERGGEGCTKKMWVFREQISLLRVLPGSCCMTLFILGTLTRVDVSICNQLKELHCIRVWDTAGCCEPRLLLLDLHPNRHHTHIIFTILQQIRPRCTGLLYVMSWVIVFAMHLRTKRERRSMVISCHPLLPLMIQCHMDAVFAGSNDHCYVWTAVHV